jgi:aromatic ring-opening dioxygenase catalytic subunit (LigB family)
LNIGYIVLRDKEGNSEVSLDEYVKQSTEKWKNAEVEKSTFSKNGIDFTRLDIDYGVWHTVRIIFHNASGKLVQFEYSTQQKKKEAELPWIEASIGTIRLM